MWYTFVKLERSCLTCKIDDYQAKKSTQNYQNVSYVYDLLPWN